MCYTTRGEDPMQQVDRSLICEFCHKKSIHTIPCYFCGKIVCSQEARYFPSKEETVQGIRTKVIRVCPNCAPQGIYG